jgi:hypothetical protein
LVDERLELVVANNKSELNVRIAQDLYDELHQAGKQQGGHFQDYVSEIFQRHLESRRAGLDGPITPAKLEHITALLADTVTRQLKKDSRWAMDVVLQAKFHLPGESVFGERIGHYSKEKERIANQFSAWLVNRITGKQHGKKKICLVIDGGSTLYWVFRALGEPLKALADRDPAAAKCLSILSINLPGIEAYMSFAQANRRGQNPEELLSQVVPCHILSGRVEPRYSAVAVENPVQALKDYKAANPDVTFIGLVTGNWIRIDRQGSSPIPLWRDKEQGEFKRGLVAICEEIYVVAPLAKVFVSSIGDINKHLGRARKMASEYRDVPEALQRKKFLRLVTTSRALGTLLREHSTKVQAKVNASDDVTGDSVADGRFSEIGSLMFPFADLRSDLSKETQLQWECPHDGTIEPDFLKWAYGIKDH